MSESVMRLKKRASQLPHGSEERKQSEQSLYQAQLVMKGAGPAGALDGYLKPRPNSKFLKLFLGAAVDVTSQRQENRLKIKEEYYEFRDKSTYAYIFWPCALLYLNQQRKKLASEPQQNGGGAFSLATAFPALVQAYWVWMLYFYAALALRENVLRANGSHIRAWWVNHHYYSIGMCLVVLTMDVQSNACLDYMTRFLAFTALQGAVMLAQNRYQRFRLYTRVAMGKANPMDVAGGEMGGNTGQLKLLYPLLFGLQMTQIYFGAVVLKAVAVEHGWTRSAAAGSAAATRAARGGEGRATSRGRRSLIFSSSGKPPRAGCCSSSWGWGTSGRRCRRGSRSGRTRRARSETDDSVVSRRRFVRAELAHLQLELRRVVRLSPPSSSSSLVYPSNALARAS